MGLQVLGRASSNLHTVPKYVVSSGSFPVRWNRSHADLWIDIYREAFRPVPTVAYLNTNIRQMPGSTQTRSFDGFPEAASSTTYDVYPSGDAIVCRERCRLSPPHTLSTQLGPGTLNTTLDIGIRCFWLHLRLWVDPESSSSYLCIFACWRRLGLLSVLNDFEHPLSLHI